MIDIGRVLKNTMTDAIACCHFLIVLPFAETEIAKQKVNPSIQYIHIYIPNLNQTTIARKIPSQPWLPFKRWIITWRFKMPPQTTMGNYVAFNWIIYTDFGWKFITKRKIGRNCRQNLNLNHFPCGLLSDMQRNSMRLGMG